MMYLYIIYLLVLSGLMILFSFYFLINKIVYVLEFEVMKLISVNMMILFLFDWISLMFIGVVLLITVAVIFYSIEYMKMEEGELYNRFMLMVVLFVFSMILMILSPNLVSILFGWDGLGLVSYCLILYYQNENSYNSGMVTILMNRVGDIMILMIVGLSFSIGSWSAMNFYKVSNLIIMMIFVASITKSAQIPFSSWLPLAMAAPTPVSALVHSSTLVTAGVYLLIRFNFLMASNILIMNLMMFLSVLTMFMSGVGANIEMDLKKIIALSTLSQLGVMIFCLSINLVEEAYFHLISHAMFKSMLFMCMGVIIHNMSGWQDIRLMGVIYFNMPLVSVLFNCSSLSLCGVPFLSGFYSKDLILDLYMMSIVNKLMFLIIYMSMGLTVSYTIRLIYYSFLNSSKFNLFMNYVMISSNMILSMVMMFFMSIFIGSMLSWLLFSLKSGVILSLVDKLLIYLFMFIGVVMGGKLFLISSGSGHLLMVNKIYMFFSSLWFMILLYKFIGKQIMFSGVWLISSVEGGWNEYIWGGALNDFIIYIYNLEFVLNKNYFVLLLLILNILVGLILIK